MEKDRCIAIVLAGGRGSRMRSSVAKQYMLLDGKPLIWYALDSVEKSDIIDECILVAGSGDLDFVKNDIINKYGFSKVSALVAGGSERYWSVWNGLRAIPEHGEAGRRCYVFIHDGARPFLDENIIGDLYRAVKEYGACVAAVPSKDTVKLADESDFARETPNRKYVWNIQTPQVFDRDLICGAYGKLSEMECDLVNQGINITDDASVVERFTDRKVKLVNASYNNIKITTPEDMVIAEAILKTQRYQL